MSLRVPQRATLAKYGLTEDQWAELAREQGGACYVCEKTPSTGILHVDHDHARGFKKMPAHEKRQRIRGLLCHWCNRAYVGRAITIDKARRVVQYLERYADRRRQIDSG